MSFWNLYKWMNVGPYRFVCLVWILLHCRSLESFRISFVMDQSQRLVAKEKFELKRHFPRNSLPSTGPHCPQISAPAISPGQKMVTNSLGNRNFMHPMGRLSMHSWWALFFLLGLGSGAGSFFLFFFLVPMCSHHVLIVLPGGSASSQVAPEDIPNYTSILSHMVCPKFNSDVYKLKS
jgi:hypothetical protein